MEGHTVIDTWRWFRPFLHTAVVITYTALVVASIMFDTLMPGLWVGQ